MKTTEVYVIVSRTRFSVLKILGNEDLEFLCVVDPVWRPEDEVVGTKIS